MNELCEKYFCLIDKAVNDPNETRVTIKGILAKFAGEVVEPEVKPRTKVEYVEVERCSIFQLQADFISLNLYRLSDDEYLIIGGEKILANEYADGTIYRKVETELTWQDVLSEKTGWTIDEINSYEKVFEHQNIGLVEMCHLVTSLTDKPKG